MQKGGRYLEPTCLAPAPLSIPAQLNFRSAPCLLGSDVLPTLSTHVTPATTGRPVRLVSVGPDVLRSFLVGPEVLSPRTGGICYHVRSSNRDWTKYMQHPVPFPAVSQYTGLEHCRRPRKGNLSKKAPKLSIQVEGYVCKAAIDSRQKKVKQKSEKKSKP